MARAVTKREADLLTQFGFRLAKGQSFETVFYNQIVTIIPSEDGMEIHYNSSYPLERSTVKVMRVDIPDGKFSSGEEQKNLDNAWIFVYYEELIDFKHDGTSNAR
jgi:hypothetical protein